MHVLLTISVEPAQDGRLQTFHFFQSDQAPPHQAVSRNHATGEPMNEVYGTRRADVPPL